MIYSLKPNDVKKVIHAKLNGMRYDKDQFLYYHLYRNYFNVKSEIKTLKRVGEKRYVDNMKNVWIEQPTYKNFFHMPKGNWMKSIAGFGTPYSRKFLRDDNVSGLGGEFEIIIRYDGKRIDAKVDAGYQETYNFGRTRDFWNHKALDVDPHNENGSYTYKVDMGKVLIME